VSDQNVTGYSFPYGVPLIFYPVLFILSVKGAGKWWGFIFLFLIVVSTLYFFYVCVSKVQYEKIHRQYPDLNRLTWIMNYLLFFVLPPAIGLTLFFAFIKKFSF
jgi:hypothetical protein